MNKVFINMMIIIIIFFASGAFSYLIQNTLKGVNNTSSLDSLPIHKADVFMQDRYKRDDYKSQGAAYNHSIDHFNETTTKLITNPDTSNSTLVRFDGPGEITCKYFEKYYAEENLSFDNCNISIEALDCAIDAFFNEIIHWKGVLEKENNITSPTAQNSLYKLESLPSTHPIKSYSTQIFNYLKTNCDEGNGSYDKQKCNIFTKIYQEEKELKNYTSNKKEYKKIDKFESYLHDILDSLLKNNYFEEYIRYTTDQNNTKAASDTKNSNSIACVFRENNTHTANPLISESRTETTNFNPTGNYQTNGGSAVSKFVSDSELDMLRIKKILFVIWILKLHL